MVRKLEIKEWFPDAPPKPVVDYTGSTMVHKLRCGHDLITYKAKSSITLRNHISTCKHTSNRLANDSTELKLSNRKK